MSKVSDKWKKEHQTMKAKRIDCEAAIGHFREISHAHAVSGPVRMHALRLQRRADDGKEFTGCTAATQPQAG